MLYRGTNEMRTLLATDAKRVVPFDFAVATRAGTQEKNHEQIP